MFRLGLSGLVLGGTPPRPTTDPTTLALRQSDHWFSAMDGDVQTRTNRGTAGGAFRNGSTDGVDANDFVHQIYDGRPTDVYAANDYGQLPASATPALTATTGSRAILLAGRTLANFAGVQRLYSAEGAANRGIWIAGEGGTLNIRPNVRGDSGTASSAPLAVVVDELFVVGIVVDNGQMWGYLHGTGFTAAVDITGVGPMTFQPPRINVRADAVATTGALHVVDVVDHDGGKAWADANFDTIALKIKAGDYS